MQLYELAEELGTSPETLRAWLKKRGFGGKGKLSTKAMSQARTQFKPPSEADSIMSHLFEEPKTPQEIKAARTVVPQQKRRRSWGKAEPLGPSVSQMSTGEQRDLIKQMRGRLDTDPAPTEKLNTHSEDTTKHSVAPILESSASQNIHVEEAKGTQSDENVSTEERFSELYYQKRYEELYTQYTAQRERLKKTDLAFKTLKEEHELLKNMRPMEQATSVRSQTVVQPHLNLKEPTLVWEELSSFSLSEGDAVNALLELIEHPIKGPELLYRLKLDEPSILLSGFRLYCGDELCYRLANQNARLGLIHVEEAQRCVICAGHDGQRWYRYLCDVAAKKGVKRLLLIGGENANTSTLKSFERSHSGLNWTFVSGDARDDQKSANSRVEGADAVLLWGGVHLPHPLSNLYKVACEQMKVPCVSIPPGQRGITAICRTALKMLGITEEELG